MKKELKMLIEAGVVIKSNRKPGETRYALRVCTCNPRAAHRGLPSFKDDNMTEDEAIKSGLKVLIVGEDKYHSL